MLRSVKINWGSVRRRAWRTKSVSDHLASAGNDGLPRVLGVVDLTFLGLGSIVGAGVYVLSGVTAHEIAGPSVILSYVVAATAALLAAFSYAEFAVEVPVAGGAFNYISVTFGELAAWSVAWNMILETMLSSSAVARGFSGYLATLMGRPPSDLLVAVGPLELDLAAAILIAILTMILSRGVKESSTLNICVCSVNLLSIAFVLIAGLPRSQVANLEPFLPFGARGMFSASSVVFFAFIGFDYIANAAEEASNPARDLPISIVGSLGVATALYVAMSATIVLLVPYTSIDVHAPFSAAFISRGMPLAARVVSLGALSGIVTSTMTGLLSQARLFVVLGRERLLPARLATVHTSTNTPLHATLLTGMCAGFMAFILDINILAELVSVGTLYVFYSVCAGVIFRRCHLAGQQTSPINPLLKIAALTITSVGVSTSYTFEAPWPVVLTFIVLWVASFAALWTLRVVRHPSRFSTPFFPATPGLGIFFTIHLLCSLGFWAYVRFAVWMVLGATVYALYGAGSAEQQEFEAKRQRQGARREQQPRQEAQLVERTLSSLDPERPMGMGDIGTDVAEEGSYLLQSGDGAR